MFSTETVLMFYTPICYYIDSLHRHNIRYLLILIEYNSCSDVYNEDPSSPTGIYNLQDGKHFCFIENTAGFCGAGGWTLALKVNGTKVICLIEFVIQPFWT